MSEEKQSGLRKLLLGDDERSEVLDKVLAYVAHRIKDGAHLGDVLGEEYVVRNTTRTQREEILTDPRLVRESREGLGQDFESDELEVENPTKAAKNQSYEDPRQRGGFTEEGLNPGVGPPSTGA